MNWRSKDAEDRRKYEQRQTPFKVAVQNSGCQRTLYQALGVLPDAGPADIKEAWRKRIIASHPDKGGDPECFHALQQAFSVLSDPNQRAIYDKQLFKTNDACSSLQEFCTKNNSKAVRSSNGVTVVVHGQTPPTQQASQHESIHHLTYLNEDIACVTSEISKLLKECNGCAWDKQQHSMHKLAKLYVQRAKLHQIGGRMHHALFDAEEAVRLNSDWMEASNLVDQLCNVQRDREHVLPVQFSNPCSESDSDCS